jgi:hypothetical protein
MYFQPTSPKIAISIAWKMSVPSSNRTPNYKAAIYLSHNQRHMNLKGYGLCRRTFPTLRTATERLKLESDIDSCH